MTKILKKLAYNNIKLGTILTLNGYKSYKEKEKYQNKYGELIRKLKGQGTFTRDKMIEWKHMLEKAKLGHIFDDSDYDITFIRYKAK